MDGMVLNAAEERLRSVRERIHSACKQAGRKPNDIELIAVSKTKPASSVEELFGLGQKTFGENYVQEANSKIKELSHLAPEIVWHFIGQLQSNKAKAVAGKYRLIHTLDRLSLAEKLDLAAKERQIIQDCLIEINIDEEPTKGGIAPISLNKTLEEWNRFSNIAIKGLMAIPKVQASPTRAPFAKMRELLEQANASAPYRNHLEILSMGMSDDFESAILEGATHIRIGTALFGPRT
jgi:PLP dependent protein